MARAGLRVGLIARLAASAPAPVFALAGPGARDAVQDLRMRDDVELCGSPRHASVLLVAGALRDTAREPLWRLHDQLAHPRAVVSWRGDHTALFADAHAAGDDAGDLAAVLRRVWAGLVAGDASSSALLPDVDPAPWRGVGPYGQGGKGMTGGVPYGRPMPGRAPDRDGLELDQLPLVVGPWFPALPAGIVLHVGLQGDVVQEARVELDGARVPQPDRDDPFVRALGEPVRIAELERGRAARHLRAVAELLRVLGLGALAVRVQRSVAMLPDDSAARVVVRELRQRRALVVPLQGIGRIDPRTARAQGLGPAARAGGVADDLRAHEPAYARLGFAPCAATGGDAAARLRQWLAEAEQALDLARAAGDGTLGPVERVEGARGVVDATARPSAAMCALLPSLLTGMEWGDAVMTIASLDLDPDEALAAADAAARP